MLSVNGLDIDIGEGPRRRGGQGERTPGADVEDSNEGEIEAREYAGEELGGEAGAEEQAPLPGGGKAGGVVGVEMGQEVRLRAGAPSIHRYHSAFHFCSFQLFLSLSLVELDSL